VIKAMAAAAWPDALRTQRRDVEDLSLIHSIGSAFLLRATSSSAARWSSEAPPLTVRSAWIAGRLRCRSRTTGRYRSRPGDSSLEGNVRRAADIHEGDKIDAKALKALIHAAVALNTSTAP